ncbi:MAG: rane-bound lytic murein transglycosylase [Bryobacterales bacterium]|nr:rane-bound lytic murein transglycosylase [Bryobacterales bacterium]
MNRKLKTVLHTSVVAVVSSLFPSSYLFPQQSNLQTSFLAPAAVRTSSSPLAADIADTEHLSYLNQVAKEQKKISVLFQPSASDLLIQKAEDRFRNGRKFYQDQSFDQARSEFDTAIDLMLQASDSPTNRSLYESRLEDLVDSIHRYDLSSLGAAVQQTVPQFDKAPLEDIVQMTFPVDPRIKEKVRTEIQTTSSALPLVMNDVVLGYINYFNGRGHKTLEYGLARAGKYRPMISRILAEEGVPQELIHLAQAESGFLPRAVSRAAAGGMWQFVKFRGNQYGLTQTAHSDDRFDPEKATRAAARHLKDLYNEFGDWYLAIAAYNCGPGCVEKAVEHTGYADYWELRARHAIPAETTNYVPIILAMTIMAKNAPEYGLDQVVPDQPWQYDTVKLTAPTNLALISDLTDASIPELQQLNPSLLRGIAPQGFDLRIPHGMGEPTQAGLDLVPAERRCSSRMHRVEAGESLAAIARRFNSSASTIAAVNQIAVGSEPAPGDKLLIPAVYREAAPAISAAARTASKGRNLRADRNQVVARGSTSGSRKSATTVAAKNPVHKTAGTIAQANRKARPLVR